MAEGHGCDMTACIELFEKIDPGVMQIQTISGNLPDTVYDRSAGKWIAGFPFEARHEAKARCVR
jgi:uncharacterized protein YcnI